MSFFTELQELTNKSRENIRQGFLKKVKDTMREQASFGKTQVQISGMHEHFCNFTYVSKYLHSLDPLFCCTGSNAGDSMYIYWDGEKRH